MRDTVYKEEQITRLANDLSLPVVKVVDIWDAYVDNLLYHIYSGSTVKFLGVCYLRVNNETYDVQYTLAYMANEIANKLAMSSEIVYRVLTSWQDIILSDLKKDRAYSIRRIATMSIEDNRLRLRKSTVYTGSGLDVRVMACPSFKRKVEGYAR